MLRVCTWVADTIELLVDRLIELVTTHIEQVCKTVTEQIEQWRVGQPAAEPPIA